jgi:arginyl-tRNA synthetase
MKGAFFRQEDGAVFIDMQDAGLDRKILLRSDGTSVYITQDIGTAELRYREVQAEKMIYVVADEQNYHFQALFEVLKRYGAPYADGLFHLSYGMVELPEGKMKSREGTVVDADDLIEEVIREAAVVAEERGELGILSQQEKEDILKKIGLGALKYFMIKVQARKRMIFDPRESVDMQGHTGPYIQNAYVRIRSVLRKGANLDLGGQITIKDIQASERELILLLTQYKEVLVAAMQEYDPSTVANYCYTLAKAFHRFYHECQILNAPEKGIASARFQLCKVVAATLEKGMNLLGIEMPDRM